ncbi:HhH-GPD superfamily base excision DNA repair protein [Caballeronia sp. SBC1]|uniref:DNA-3-methyladenine glycosylase family protein n=1 Tax=unclassified Caballeronia TaxID=2646786 RepID=UPI0013E1BEC4|nr:MULTISPECIES: DNA-3-methyladenine glycosylase [unclassified Caballeronia]QIE23361.1 HhH-GPD superfamily base excision DNA repair protein [Caballeronia sp. SBC2]QIN61254.1 HhH-GPD superfamily base excision DNA repair protein [Caballeronia sp. SBC1]
MATARKAPAKRAASGSIAVPASRVARRAQVKTSKVSTPEAKLANGAAHDGERKTASKKRAVNGVVHDGVAKTNGLVRAHKTVRATAPKVASKVAPKKASGDANGVLDVKAVETNVSADAMQALVRAPQSDGEIVRKSRAITAEKTVPVQTPGLSVEAARPEYWDKACADLVKRDRILKKLIPKFGPVHLINRDDPFTTLARSVVGQQISVTAAQAIWKRVEGACPTLAPQQFIKVGPAKLQSCGLSKRKSEYILDVAQHFVSGALHVDSWTSMEDEAVIAELTQIRGIGRWTAEMFLIFNLSRPDVLPLDDLGLIQAISVNYFSGEPVTRSEAREVAANWEPWRTVATWYMWRSLYPVPADH